ncbi:MAG TPA: type VI secretion system tube protein Hcp [Thermoanaerobaculia bacterium]|nr:type VI secretion system tube protein Hcp [Thermoanaerobaculia bacterium]
MRTETYAKQDWEELEEPGESEAVMGFDAFLKIEGVDGESQDDKHKNEIEVLRWSGRVEQQGSAQTGGGMGSGKSYHHEFKIVKTVDKATPKLFERCCTGEHFDKAVLVVRKAGGEQREFLKFTLSDVLISSNRPFHEPDPKSGLPREGVGLSYGKIEMEYMPQTSKGTLAGTIKAGWNVKENKLV